MKIRMGFVSNSSSSSFCVIGTRWMLDKLAAKTEANEDDFGHGVCETKLLQFHGSCFEDSIAGIDAEPLLEEMSIPKAKEHFRKYILKNTGVDIPLERIVFEYGEAGNE